MKEKGTNRRASAAGARRAVQAQPWWALLLAIVALTASAFAVVAAGLTSELRIAASADFLVSLFLTHALAFKSILDFSQTGPGIQEEVLKNFRFYSLRSFLRLCSWALLLSLLMGGFGIFVYTMLVTVTGLEFSAGGVIIAAVLGVAVIVVLQFLHHLLMLPSSLCASLNYRPSRLYALWQRLTPGRLKITLLVGAGLLGLLSITASAKLLWTGQDTQLIALWGGILFYSGLLTWALWEPSAPVAQGQTGALPNILMIGSDTLRSDRLGASGYHRSITPTIDRLAAAGVSFSECFVPCARTAPSLVSLLTGTWPHRHGIRDNFVADDETALELETLPLILKQHGYLTAAISDWSGSDLGKFPFGFDVKDLPKDQWNIKYLIRQGPKDMRMFLSLFTHNRFGKTFLPEIYYLAGVPLTRQVGLRGRRALSYFAATEQPFFLNIFCAATHPPFGSDHPYYTLYSDPSYQGESKFVMARLTDPFEIIRRQGEAKTEFDLDQILNLYDGCVKSFDDEVERLLSQLDACGLTDNTIVVIYSDHGMEFFEHGTWGQGNSAVGDFSPRVPLVIKDPRLKPTGTVKQVVRSIDIAPTLLELAGIDSKVSAMDGISLVPAIKGEDLELVAYNETGIWLTDLPGTHQKHLRYPVLFKLLNIPKKRSGTLSIHPEYRHAIIQAKDRMVRYGRWKLVYQPLTDGPSFALYDIVSDPGCCTDVQHEYPYIAQQMRDTLHSYLLEDNMGNLTPIWCDTPNVAYKTNSK